jgi:pectin methylesterase-like acyl-CoA thioesterase
MKKILYPFILFLMLGISQVSGQSQSKTDVWDFGAEALDTAIYINHLDSATINSWYLSSITPGTSGVVLPGFTTGILSFTAGTNDRLRTTNLKLTRYDQNIASVVGYTGRVYVNSAASTARYLSLTLNEDDEVTLVEKTDAGGKINFVYVADPAAQTDAIPVTINLDTLTFVAKSAGTYRIYDNVGKPSYFRIFRKAAEYVTIRGTVDTSQAAGMTPGYGINFTNSAGKTWNSVIAADTFSIKVPVGYTYTLSLSDANGFIIGNGSALDVSANTTSHFLELRKCDLFTVTGSISGLDAGSLAKTKLVFSADTAAHKIYIPSPVIDAGAGTYSVQLEPYCTYVVSATGINDYFIEHDSVNIAAADSLIDLAFTAKPVHPVNIDVTGLSAEQLAKLALTFTNLNEPDYTYSFAPGTGISLRDGTYSVAFSGLDEYPVQLGLTSNVVVDGVETSKALVFGPITNWSFDDMTILNGTTIYRGLKFTGNVSSELLKGHLAAKPGATIEIPVNPGEKVKVTYYSTAAFSIAGADTFTTASNSTSILEYAGYVYPDTVAGYVMINILAGATTSYFPEISVAKAVAFEPVIYVGTDKEYKTINEALTAIENMERDSAARVTVMIDPGNYEEMLVINSPWVSLKNASLNPSIALSNKGVDIDAQAVRISSYYGHGYSYYSMGSNQKWNADILRVNKENGYLSYENKGSGTTNGSYWNATVVVNADFFEAENIIFENSFNQYISRKEADDVVVMWEVGNKGMRPTDIGNTAVQNRSFVERAAAFAITNGSDQTMLRYCRVVGRQDALFGGTGARLAVYKGVVMGAVDYIFGPMTAVFYKTDMVMNTSDVSSDAAYLTAAQQTGGRGYLMYRCNVKSTIPGIETASVNSSKPGYFGRPWQAATSEVVFYHTAVDISEFPGSEGKSLIVPVGWNNTLGGESSLMYEYGTFEKSGEDNSASRAAWSTVLEAPFLTDETPITPFSFNKGTDNWDPIIPEADTLVLSETSLIIAEPGSSSNTFEIASNISWRVESNQDWLAVSKTSGSDAEVIILTATSANTSTTARTAVVTVTGNGVNTQTIEVTQDGVAIVLSVSSTALAVDAAPGSTVTFDITSNIGWTVESDQSWLAIGNGSGTGNSTITLTAEANTGTTTRVATITVSGMGADPQSITVTQSAGTSGINGFSEKEITLHPNPVKNRLTINDVNENAVISIYNASGSLLICKTAEKEIEQIDVRSLGKGVYLVKVTDKESVKVDRFVKE